MTDPDQHPPTTAAETPERESAHASRAHREDDGNQKSRSERVRDLIALVLLSMTAVLTAWCGFESSKWGGDMSISFSRASTARIEAAREQGVANNARQEDLTIWSVYVQAVAEDKPKLSGYVESRFTDHFKVAFDAWNAADRPTRAPFSMPEYVPPGTKEAEAADRRADGLFAAALVSNQRGDNYTILTVLAALVLFFAALSGRLSGDRRQWVILGLALVLFVTGAVIAATFPVMI